MTSGRGYAQLVRDAAAWCLDHRGLTAGLALALLAVSAIGAMHIEIDPTPEAYLEGTEAWAFYERVNQLRRLTVSSRE